MDLCLTVWKLLVSIIQFLVHFLKWLLFPTFLQSRINLLSVSLYCCLYYCFTLTSTEGTPICASVLALPNLSFLNDIYHQQTSFEFSAHWTFNPIAFTRSHCLSLVPSQSTINSGKYLFFANKNFFGSTIPIHILENSNQSSFWHHLYDHLCVN